MGIEIRAYEPGDASAAAAIWNRVVERLGTVPGGFRIPDGSFEDIILFYHLV